MSDFNLLPLLPEIFVALTAMGLLLVGAFNHGGKHANQIVCWSSVAVLGFACVVMFGLHWDEPKVVLNGMFVFNNFVAYSKILILLALAAAMALSVRYLKDEGLLRFEYPVLVLLAGLGMMLMVSAHNFLGLYMGLELQSLSLYVLAAFHRGKLRSAEAGIKYFILGAVSSGMLLFGVSLIYGTTGSLDFEIVRSFIGGADIVPLGATVGLVFIVAALAFKVSAVPFHMWTPDVYEGAPTAVTALFALVPKIAGVVLLLRVLYEPFADMAMQWQQLVYFMAVGSMVVGAFAALVQDNLKRLLAYSSIGHVGYALIAVVTNSAGGVGAVLVYMMIYMVMTAGVFGVVLSLRRNHTQLQKISDLAGLSQTNPVLAYIMAVMMFSMSGIPPMAGFFGKLVVFQAALSSGYYILAVLGVLSSVVAAYYYLRIIKVMFFEDATDAMDNYVPFARKVVLAASTIFVLGFIFKTSYFISSAQDAASALF